MNFNQFGFGPGIQGEFKMQTSSNTIHHIITSKNYNLSMFSLKKEINKKIYS